MSAFVLALLISSQIAVACISAWIVWDGRRVDGDTLLESVILFIFNLSFSVTAVLSALFAVQNIITLFGV